MNLIWIHLDSLVAESAEDLKISIEGKIQQKLECRPHADMRYMMLKQEEIKKAAQPVRQVVQLERVVNSYKPVANHKHNVWKFSSSIIVFHLTFDLMLLIFVDRVRRA